MFKLVLATVVVIGASVGLALVNQPPTPPAAGPVADAKASCAIVGIRPDGLVLAGFQPQGVSSLLARVEAAEQEREMLTSTMSAVSDVQQQISLTTELLRSTPGNAEAIAAMSRLRDQLAQAQRQFEVAQTAVWDAAFRGVGAEAVAMCAAVREVTRSGHPALAAVGGLNERQQRQVGLDLRARNRQRRLGQEVVSDPTSPLSIAAVGTAEQQLHDALPAIEAMMAPAR